MNAPDTTSRPATAGELAKFLVDLAPRLTRATKLARRVLALGQHLAALPEQQTVFGLGDTLRSVFADAENPQGAFRRFREQFNSTVPSVQLTADKAGTLPVDERTWGAATTEGLLSVDDRTIAAVIDLGERYTETLGPVVSARGMPVGRWPVAIVMMAADAGSDTGRTFLKRLTAGLHAAQTDGFQHFEVINPDGEISTRPASIVVRVVSTAYLEHRTRNPDAERWPWTGGSPMEISVLFSTVPNRSWPPDLLADQIFGRESGGQPFTAALLAGNEDEWISALVDGLLATCEDDVPPPVPHGPRVGGLRNPNPTEAPELIEQVRRFRAGLGGTTDPNGAEEHAELAGVNSEAPAIRTSLAASSKQPMGGTAEGEEAEIGRESCRERV